MKKSAERSFNTKALGVRLEALRQKGLETRGVWLGRAVYGIYRHKPYRHTPPTS